MFTNRLINFTRPGAFLLSLILILFLFNPAYGQNAVKPVAEWLEAHRPVANFEPVALFQTATEGTEFQQVVAGAQVLELDPKAVKTLHESALPALQFSIPTAVGATLELELIQVEILGAGFSVSTNTQDALEYQPSIHYRGIVRGNPHSIACISVSNEGIMGMVSDESGVYELGQLEDGSGRYLYYPTKQLKALSPNHCFAEEESLFPSNEDEPAAGDRGVGCKTVQVDRKSVV